MPRPRSAMRKIREVLRLTFAEGLSRRQVGAALRMPYTTVADYLSRLRRAGLGWPLPDDMDDAALEARLFTSAALPPGPTRPVPDWPTVHRELRRKGVTLQLLWLEFKTAHPDGYQYTQFVRHYRRWQRRLDVVMRQEHRAGEKCFLDFPGDTLPIVDPTSGEVTEAQLFVAVLGASNYTYAEAVASQALPDWVDAHVHMFAFYGAVPAILVPEYVPGNIFRLLWPSGLCGQEPPASGDHVDGRLNLAATGHITIRARRASSGGTRPIARLASSGIPPKCPKARPLGGLPLWPGC